MSIRDRACAMWDEYVKPEHTDIIEAFVQFATAERALQRQECAEAYRSKQPYGYWIEDVQDAILSAGTEPEQQGPFGCSCGWELETVNPNAKFDWWLRHKGGIHLDHQCDYCPKCGKARVNSSNHT